MTFLASCDARRRHSLPLSPPASVAGLRERERERERDASVEIVTRMLDVCHFLPSSPDDREKRFRQRLTTCESVDCFRGKSPASLASLSLSRSPSVAAPERFLAADHSDLLALPIALSCCCRCCRVCTHADSGRGNLLHFRGSARHESQRSVFNG